MTRIGRWPVHVPVRRGVNRGNDSRKAAEAHHTLSPGWTPVRVFARSGRPVMRFEMQARPPLPYPASGALHGQETCSTAAAGRVRASVCALPDLTRFPARSGRSRWATPPTQNRRRLGSAIAAATLFELPAISVRLPPAVRRPCGQGAAYWAAAERLAPLCRFAAERPPTPSPCRRQSDCAPLACLDSQPAQTACGRQCSSFP